MKEYAFLRQDEQNLESLIYYPHFSHRAHGVADPQQPLRAYLEQGWVVIQTHISADRGYGAATFRFILEREYVCHHKFVLKKARDDKDREYEYFSCELCGAWNYGHHHNG